MAKARINSKKGGASSHLRPCKVAYCDKHNERLDENPSNKNIRPEFSTRNSVWKDPDVPNLVTLDRQIRKDYFIHNNRHMPNRGPSKASPLKESVTLMPNGDFATDEIQKKIVARIEEEFGIRCIRMYNHRDEYCDETRGYNWHGHEVWDMYDHENHRMRSISRADCRKWQDIVAEETGMPRGNPAYETRRKWLSATEYKIKMQEEAIKEKSEEIEKKEEALTLVSMNVDQEFNLKDALEKYNDELLEENEALDKRNAQLKGQNGQLQQQNDQLRQRNEWLETEGKKKSEIIEIAKSVENMVKGEIQNIFDTFSRRRTVVTDFRIARGEEIAHPVGGISYDNNHDQYEVDVMTDDGHASTIIIDQNDYFSPDKDIIHKQIASLFLALDEKKKKVLDATKSSTKSKKEKRGVRM